MSAHGRRPSLPRPPLRPRRRRLAAVGDRPAVRRHRPAAARRPRGALAAQRRHGRPARRPRSAATPTRRPRGCWTSGSARAPSSATTTPALWALQQDYTGPDGRALTRRGFFARVRVEEYGPGKIRPHERTHPGPKEDRLRLTRATKTNMSPIFSLYDDPEQKRLGRRSSARSPTPTRGARRPTPTARSTASGASPTAPRSRRVKMALGDTELLIADGHHRYETARVYAEEIGGEGEHRYVLMCLVALQDPGLTIFPTHRLLNNLKDAETQQKLGRYLREHFEVTADRQGRAAPARRRPGRPPTPLTMGYIDSFHQQAYRLVLKDQAEADAALADYPEPYRHLDTAVLEALIFKGVLGMTEDDVAHLNGLGYSRTDDGGAAARRVQGVRLRLLPAGKPCPPGPGDRRRGRQHAAQVHVLLPQGPDRTRVQPARLEPFAIIDDHEGHRHPLRQPAPGHPDPRLQPDDRRARGQGRRGHRPQPAGDARRVAGRVHRHHDGDVRQAQGLGRRRRRGRLRLHARPSAAARRASTSSCASRTRSATSRSSACA